MPIYEYQCRRCGRRIEAMQRLSDPPLAECEECGGELRKLISAPAFQFKGSGWYVTDYAKSGGNGKKPDEGKPAEAAKSGGDKGGEKSSPAPAAAGSGGSSGATSGATSGPKAKD